MPMLRPASFLCGLFCVLLLASPAGAGERLALLIGNEAYAGGIPRLRNPVNDVTMIAETLQIVGFRKTSIRVLRDIPGKELENEVQAFARRLAAAGKDAVGYFHFAGHGISDGTQNYLVPVDADTTSLIERSVPLRQIIDQLRREAPEAILFVVSDACRNTLAASDPGVRGISGNVATDGRGLTPVAGFRKTGEVDRMLIAFSTDEGATASDAGERAGPYAVSLAERLLEPGVPPVSLFFTVQVEVAKQTNGAQVPWFTQKGLPDFYFREAGTVLPDRDDDALKALDRAIERRGRSLAGARLLWVDDNQHNNYYERQELRKAGVDVDLVGSTREAIDRIWVNGTRHYHLIVSDFRRDADPDDGFGLLDKMKSLPERPPLIFYTGLYSSEQEREALARGAFGETSDPAELIAFIRRAHALTSGSVRAATRQAGAVKTTVRKAHSKKARAKKAVSKKAVSKKTRARKTKSRKSRSSQSRSTSARPAQRPQAALIRRGIPSVRRAISTAPPGIEATGASCYGLFLCEWR